MPPYNQFLAGPGYRRPEASATSVGIDDPNPGFLAPIAGPSIQPLGGGVEFGAQPQAGPGNLAGDWGTPPSTIGPISSPVYNLPTQTGQRIPPGSYTPGFGPGPIPPPIPTNIKPRTGTNNPYLGISPINPFPTPSSDLGMPDRSPVRTRTSPGPGFLEPIANPIGPRTGLNPPIGAGPVGGGGKPDSITQPNMRRGSIDRSNARPGQSRRARRRRGYGRMGMF